MPRPQHGGDTSEEREEHGRIVDGRAGLVNRPPPDAAVGGAVSRRRYGLGRGMNVAHVFADPSLLETALTHRSWAVGRRAAPHNERLEFLGDAVVQLVVTELLMEARPGWREGDLSKTRSVLVNTASLARLADLLELGPALRLGRGEDRQGQRTKPGVLADVFEAVIGAVYTDGGLDAVRAMARPLFEPLVAALTEAPKDARSLLQERLHVRGAPPPVYRDVGAEGEAHERAFLVEVDSAGVTYGPGRGSSRKGAALAAAQLALAGLEGR